MAEASLVARTKFPVTVDSLAAQLIDLGLTKGHVVLVHSSLSSLGWVNGGPVAVVEALIKAVGENGTVVMPSQTRNVTDPANWTRPAVPEHWRQIIRDTMPVFDQLITPTHSMGQVAEVFRTWPGSVRSAHPSCSFVARGPQAVHLMAGHELEDPLGESSPLGKMYSLGGVKILLIGVTFDKCTALHLAECKRGLVRPSVKEGAPMLINGKRRWVEFENPQEPDTEIFNQIGASAVESGLTKVHTLGEGFGMIMDMKDLVDIAVDLWPDDHPL
jgi:aminoglycoside 3-N-acetyltransferase